MVEMKQNMYCALGKIDGSFGLNLCSLAKAVEYSHKIPKIEIESKLYLENADSDD